MRKYMWPNSCLPSATALIQAAYAGSGGRFTLENVENHAAREWSTSFLSMRPLPANCRLPSHPADVGPPVQEQRAAGRCRGDAPISARSGGIRGVRTQVGVPVRVRGCGLR